MLSTWLAYRHDATAWRHLASQNVNNNVKSILHCVPKKVTPKFKSL